MKAWAWALLLLVCSTAVAAAEAGGGSGVDDSLLGLGEGATLAVGLYGALKCAFQALSCDRWPIRGE